MRIRRTLAALATSAGLLAASLAGAPPAAAAVDCEYNDTVGNLFVGMTGDGVATLARDGDTILVNGLTCSDGGTDATVTNVEIVSLRRTAGVETSSIALASRSNACRVPSASSAPCAVSFSPRGRRSKSRTPSRCSSCFTCLLTAA